MCVAIPVILSKILSSSYIHKNATQISFKTVLYTDEVALFHTIPIYFHTAPHPAPTHPPLSLRTPHLVNIIFDKYELAAGFSETHWL